MSLKTAILGIFSGAVENIAESELETLLQGLHDENVDNYKAAIYGGNALVNALLPVVTKSANKIDDAVVNALHDAIVKSAATNGIDLNTPINKTQDDDGGDTNVGGGTDPQGGNTGKP